MKVGRASICNEVANGNGFVGCPKETQSGENATELTARIKPPVAVKRRDPFPDNPALQGGNLAI